MVDAFYFLLEVYCIKYELSQAIQMLLNELKNPHIPANYEFTCNDILFKRYLSMHEK
jgi:hypothetical protein